MRAALAIALGMAGFSATAHDLSSLMDDASANNATLKSAESAYRAEIEKEPQGRSGLLPQISVQQTTYRNGVRIPGQPIPGYSTIGISLSLMQPLFKWDAWETYQQGKLAVIGAQIKLQKAEQDLRLDVSQAYFDVLTAQQDLLLAQMHEKAVSEQLALAKRRFALGDATLVDSSEAQAGFDSANADRIGAETERDIKLAAIEKIVGHAIRDVDRWHEALVIPPLDPPDVDSWIDAAVSSNYEVCQNEIAIELAKRERSKARSGHYPTVSLVGGLNNGNAAFINGQSNFNTGGNRGTSGSIGIQISLPITDGLLTQSRVRETLALVDKARDDLLQSRHDAEFEARQAFLGVMRGTARVRALETAVSSAALSLKSNQVGYRVGVRVNADVLAAQDKQFQAQRELVHARADVLIQSLKLKASVANLERSDTNGVMTEYAAFNSNSKLTQDIFYASNGTKAKGFDFFADNSYSSHVFSANIEKVGSFGANGIINGYAEYIGNTLSLMGYFNPKGQEIEFDRFDYSGKLTGFNQFTYRDDGSYLARAYDATGHLVGQSSYSGDGFGSSQSVSYGGGAGIKIPFGGSNLYMFGQI